MKGLEKSANNTIYLLIFSLTIHTSYPKTTNKHHLEFKIKHKYFKIFIFSEEYEDCLIEDNI